MGTRRSSGRANDDAAAWSSSLGTFRVGSERKYGFPQGMQLFVDCVPNDEQPLETGEDGRAVLEIAFAAYESAATGRRAELPFTRPEGKKPIDLWLR